MSVARNLLDDLAGIGATIKPAGDRLILRAGLTAIPADLVSRVRKAKANLLATLTAGADHPKLRSKEEQEHDREPPHDGIFESRIVEWLNQHPTPSTAGRCAWCGRLETPGGSREVRRWIWDARGRVWLDRGSIAASLFDPGRGFATVTSRWESIRSRRARPRQ
jgi:hypothetical protein